MVESQLIILTSYYETKGLGSFAINFGRDVTEITEATSYLTMQGYSYAIIFTSSKVGDFLVSVDFQFCITCEYFLCIFLPSFKVAVMPL